MMAHPADDKLLITIDGPAGAGKTTVSRTLADQLGYRYVDTGALYRAVALAAMQAAIASDDEAGLKTLCQYLQITFQRDDQGTRLISGGRDITDAIRTPEISMTASAVSAMPVVRSYLLTVQRDLGNQKAAVFEGRDMGTVVFPQADMKFFLDADIEIRARRRWEEIRAQSRQTYAEVYEDMKTRDHNDRNRSVAPLQPAHDAIHIDCTDLNASQVVAQMIAHLTRLKNPPASP